MKIGLFRKPFLRKPQRKTALSDGMAEMDTRIVFHALHDREIKTMNLETIGITMFPSAICGFFGVIMKVRNLCGKPGGQARWFLMLSVIAFTGCGGASGVGSTSTPAPVESTLFQGSWEFVATSTANPPPGTPVRLIEANLEQSGEQVSSAQLAAYYYNATGWTPPIQLCGEECVTAFSGTATGASFSFTSTLDDCDSSPCSFQGKGSLTDGTISGTWSLQDGTGTTGNTDSGTFTAIPASTLSGAYTGNLTTCVAPTAASGCKSYGSDKASVTFSQSSTTITAVLSGTDNGTFTSTPFTAPFVGNAFSFSSPIPGGASWYGYYDQTGKYTGVKNSVVIFAGDAGPSSGMYMGLLQEN